MPTSEDTGPGPDPLDGEIGWGFGVDDAAVAVVAHGLLNSISAIQMGAHALRESWAQMTDEQREQVLGLVVDQAAHVRGILSDLIRGLPLEVVRALNGLTGDEDAEP